MEFLNDWQTARVGLLVLCAAMLFGTGCGNDGGSDDSATISSVDRDVDGLSDAQERAGWEIQIDEFGLGTNVTPNLLTVRTVTSDPNQTDTDGDGLDDLVEYLILSDPRLTDTDGDGLTDFEEWNQWLTNPVSVDSDGDARGPDRSLAPNAIFFDGNELAGPRATSPSLADTDGDGKTDFEEFDDPVRSPLIAEIPEIAVSFEGDVDVRLNIEFAESVGQETRYGTTMTQSQTTSSSRTDSHTESWKFSGEVSLNPLAVGDVLKRGLGGSFGVEYGFQDTTSFTESSSTTAQQEHSRYVADSLNKTETAASGSISLGLRLTNVGVSTYEVNSLGMTVLQWQQSRSDPSQNGDFKTVATLTPDLTGITLAPRTSSSIIRVAAEDVDASLIKEFLADPTTLHYETTAFELINDAGINFEFLTEQTFARTAFLEIDFGDGDIERYRVATNTARNADSSYAGISMQTILRDVLAIPYTLTENPNEPGQLILESVRDKESEPASTGPLPQATWVVGTTSLDESADPVDFDEIVVKAGDSVRLVYLRDRDQDGLADLSEQLFGSSDENPDSDGPAGDGLDDRFETQVGWDVGPIEARDGSSTAAYRVFSDPTSVDADGDGLTDDQELLARTDPTKADTDGDGLDDGFEVAYDDDGGEDLALRAAPRLYVSRSAGVDCRDDESAGLSWGTACEELRDALARAAERNATESKADDIREVWVAEGIYRPAEPGLANARFESFRLADLLALYGGFVGGESKRDQRNSNPITNSTVLSGDLAADDIPDSGNRGENSFHVVLAPSALLTSGVPLGKLAVLDGFTIASGNANGPAPLLIGDPTDHRHGGGVYIDGGSPTLARLAFRLNSAALLGGGLFDRASTTELSDCVFLNNEAERGGGMASRASSSQISDCKYRQNLARVEGGGLYYEVATADSGAGLVVERSDFTLNRSLNDGAGVSIVGGRHRFSDTIVRMNETDEANDDQNGGGLFVRNAELLLVGSLVADNFSDDEGGGMWVSGSEVHLVESTIAMNTADDSTIRTFPSSCRPPPQFFFEMTGVGGGVYSVDSQIFSSNSILVGNDARQGDAAHSEASDDAGTGCSDQEQLYPASANVESSCVGSLNWFAGSGNVDPGDAEATFAAANLGNYQLKPESPCIDAGNPFADSNPFAAGFQQPSATDLSGRPRVVDGDGNGEAIIDMGSYEFQP